MSLGPVIPRSTLPKYKIVRSKESSVATSLDGIHRTGLQVYQHGARDVLALGGFIVVNVDAVQLDVGIAALVGAGAIEAVLVGERLPEFGA